ncbi:hypothetical protein SAMN05518670_0720 [Paenibacillus sp. OK076]|nr:hypothetical protein SAMN05518670_0720 [Paenibacillus sp. OK076]
MDNLSILIDAMVRLRNSDLRVRDVKGELFID